jgi:hypothetical protein
MYLTVICTAVVFVVVTAIVTAIAVLSSRTTSHQLSTDSLRGTPATGSIARVCTSTSTIAQAL